MGDTPASRNGGWADEDTSAVNIRVRDLQDRQLEHRKDLREHDGEIRTLQGQVARIDERVKFMARAFWLGAAGIGALVGDAILRHFH